MNKETFKRRYFDLRQGSIVIMPMVSFTNFLMLAYLTINDVIPLWIFAPVFLITLIATLVIVGRNFRKIQLNTDMDLNYERASSAGVTVYFMMLAELEIMKAQNIHIPQGFLDRMEYMRKIGYRQIE